MYCWSCGTKALPGDRHCGDCGARLNRPEGVTPEPAAARQAPTAPDVPAAPAPPMSLTGTPARPPPATTNVTGAAPVPPKPRKKVSRLWPGTVGGNVIYVLIVGGVLVPFADELAEQPVGLLIIIPTLLVLLTFWRNVLIGFGLIGDDPEEHTVAVGADGDTVPAKPPSKAWRWVGLIVFVVALGLIRDCAS